MTHPNVRFGSKADICSATAHVRSTPNSDIDCVLRKSRQSPELPRGLGIFDFIQLFDRTQIVLGPDFF
jgi:hypothetical protein